MKHMQERKSQASAIIISVSSDIGLALAERWQNQGIKVVGTFRTPSPKLKAMKSVDAIHCDLGNKASVQKACDDLICSCPFWDYLILCPGAQEPVGDFMGCDFDQWEASIEVNFSRQIQMVHRLLPYRNIKNGKLPVVLFFAGGGANNATVNYSAYTISKIALIKMCELLDAEILDASFAILGPGWVKTKIHNATIQAGEKAGGNYQKTIEKLASNECTPMESVLDCCDWIVNSPRNIISGRNFSVVFDAWGTPELTAQLAADPSMYKLRRHGNGWQVKN